MVDKQRHPVDVFGFALATAFLVAVYTVFGIIGRLLDVVSAGIRTTVAPTMLSGFRAWTEPADEAPGRADAANPHPGGTEPGGPEAGEGDTRTVDERRLEPGLVVPVAPLERRGRRWLVAA